MGSFVIVHPTVHSMTNPRASSSRVADGADAMALSHREPLHLRKLSHLSTRTRLLRISLHCSKPNSWFSSFWPTSRGTRPQRLHWMPSQWFIDLFKRITPVNVGNLSAFRRPANMAKEPAIFMIYLEVKAILRREKEKAFVFSVYKTWSHCIQLRWLQDYLMGYGVPLFHKFDGQKGNTRSKLYTFLTL